MANTMMGHTETIEYMAQEEYKKAYREGFQDGYAAYQRAVLSPYIPQPTPPKPQCPVCFMDWSKPLAYCCPRSDCPRAVFCAGNNSQVMLTE